MGLGWSCNLRNCVPTPASQGLSSLPHFVLETSDLVLIFLQVLLNPKLTKNWLSSTGHFFVNLGLFTWNMHGPWNVRSAYSMVTRWLLDGYSTVTWHYLMVTRQLLDGHSMLTRHSALDGIGGVM